MTDSTDDIADVLLEDFEKLQDDCKWLGVLLDDCLRGEVGEELFKKTERIRNLAGCASQLAGSDEARAPPQLTGPTRGAGRGSGRLVH